MTCRFMNRDECALYTGIPIATLRTMATRGGGPPFFKMGRKVVYDMWDVDRWIESRKQEWAESEAERLMASAAEKRRMAHIRRLKKRRKAVADAPATMKRARAAVFDMNSAIAKARRRNA